MSTHLQREAPALPIALADVERASSTVVAAVCDDGAVLLVVVQILTNRRARLVLLSTQTTNTSLGASKAAVYNGKFYEARLSLFHMSAIMCKYILSTFHNCSQN